MIPGLSQRLYDATGRVEQMIWLDAMAADSESIPDVLRDFLDDATDAEKLSKLFPDAVKEVLESVEDGETEEFLRWIVEQQVTGFLVQFATPVKTILGGGMTSFSWGHYATKWVFGKTLEDAVKAGFEFFQEQRAREKVRALQGGAQ